MGQQFTGVQFSNWSLWPHQSRLLVHLGIPEYNLDLHDMLPRIPLWKDGPETSWKRIRVTVFHRRHGRHRVCTSLYTIAFLVSLGLGSPTFVTFICVYLMMMVCGSHVCYCDSDN